MRVWMKNKRKAHESLNPYYTGSTLWVQSESLQDEEETVLILIILEVLYEYQASNKAEAMKRLNPYYTGSTLWEKLLLKRLQNSVS